MSLEFYIDDYGPVPATVTEEDGITPATPLSATATIVNTQTGEVLVTDASCLVEEGLASYIIPDGSPITDVSARYVAYISVVIDATTKQTVQVPFDVLDKASYLVVDRWRRKVEFSAPNDGALSDQEGRDWVDQAVAYLNRRYTTGFTSVLASITPEAGVADPDDGDIEMIAAVAGLMARTAWWAGKGSWRDEEMSLDTGPFRDEWAALEEYIGRNADAGWFTLDNLQAQWNMYNRDKIDRWGHSDAPDDYFNARWAHDPVLSTTSWYE
jgi:hypothetical protein